VKIMVGDGRWITAIQKRQLGTQWKTCRVITQIRFEITWTWWKKSKHNEDQKEHEHNWNKEKHPRN
jgi:hypothetical protein